jgi:hypothetical protein
MGPICAAQRLMVRCASEHSGQTGDNLLPSGPRLGREPQLGEREAHHADGSHGSSVAASSATFGPSPIAGVSRFTRRTRPRTPSTPTPTRLTRSRDTSPTQVASLTREHIDAWLADRATQARPSTVRNRYTGVRMFFPVGLRRGRNHGDADAVHETPTASPGRGSDPFGRTGSRSARDMQGKHVRGSPRIRDHLHPA